MSYTDFLKDCYKGLKIIIFGDLNLRKLCLRRGTRKYTHDWTYNRNSVYTVTDYYLCMGPGVENLMPPEDGCFSNSDHRILKLQTKVDWTTRRMKKAFPNRMTRMT